MHVAFKDLEKEPLPPGFKGAWRDTLERNVAIYRRMPEDVKRDLEALIRWFIDKVEWSSHDGFRLTETIKVCIAAEACCSSFGDQKMITAISDA